MVQGVVDAGKLQQIEAKCREAVQQHQDVYTKAVRLALAEQINGEAGSMLCSCMLLSRCFLICFVAGQISVSQSLGFAQQKPLLYKHTAPRSSLQDVAFSMLQWTCMLREQATTKLSMQVRDRPVQAGCQASELARVLASQRPLEELACCHCRSAASLW